MIQSSISTHECKNCTNGFVIYQKPANKIMINGVRVYGDQADFMVDYAAPCPICNGGDVLVENIQEKANIPASFYDIDMGGFDWTVYEDNRGQKIDATNQRIVAESFVNDFATWKKRGFGLYIWSSTKGSGKTYLASAICNSLIKKYTMKPKFVSAASLIEMDKDGRTDELINTELLVLDDLGQNNVGQSWITDILFKIFDTRMQKHSLTIVTSNLPMGQLRFDDRISDRMYKTMQELPLPDFNVRAREATKAKGEMFKTLGLGNKQVEMEATA